MFSIKQLTTRPQLILLTLSEVFLNGKDLSYISYSCEYIVNSSFCKHAKRSSYIHIIMSSFQITGDKLAINHFFGETICK